jgi:hypothetical protein
MIENATVVDDWFRLSTGQMSDEDTARLVARAAKGLHTFLETHPEATSHVLDILRRRLGSEINAVTWQVLETSLVNYIGWDSAYLASWIVRPDHDERLQVLEKQASTEVIAFFRAILGLYGPELERAFVVWNELPDNWCNIHRDVYYDQLLESHHLKVRIDKYNGEAMVIEGPPDSFLALVSYLIFTVRLVGIPHAFSQARIELFLRETDQLIRVLQQEKEMIKLLRQKMEEAVPAGPPESEAAGEPA